MGCEWNVGGTVGGTLGSTCDKDNLSAKILSLDENVMQLNKATVCLACYSISLRQKTLTWRIASVFDMDLTSTSSLITLSAD